MFKFLYLFIVVLLFVSCNSSQTTEGGIKEWNYLCDAEQTNGKTFSDANHSNLEFNGLKFKSDEASHSGKFSLKLTSNNKYGFTTEINFVKPDEFFHVTVWRKAEHSKGFLTVSTKGFQKATDEVIETDENGWEKLQLDFFSPPNISEPIKVFVWNNDDQTVYFDDLNIIRQSERSYPNYDLDKSLKLYYSAKANEKIQQVRRNSFDHGNIIVGDDDYVSSIIFTENDYMETSIRIKGDWLDHVQGDKISFRVKTKADYAWKGMKTFSIQTPEARNFQHEWVLHKMLLNNDRLTTRFGFIPTYVNGKSKGIFAWEEHFDKQIIESSNRREGPVIRFDESIFWNTVRLNNENKIGYDIPFFEAAKITPFKAGKVLKSPQLLNEFLEAQTLLHQVQTQSSTISEIFDIKKFADFYVYNLVNKTYHGLAWHNIRYYYNPVLCKLEPITYDGGYVENAAFDDRSIIGARLIDNSRSYKRETGHFYMPLKDTVYLNEVYKSLDKITDKTFLDNQFAKIQQELNSDEKLIQQEFTNYKYSNEHIYSKAKELRSLLPIIEKNIHSKDFINQNQAIHFEDVKHLTTYYPTLNDQMIVVYELTKANGTSYLQIKNYTSDTISIVSGKNHKDILDSKIEVPIKVAPINNFDELTVVSVDNFYDEYYVHIPSIDEYVTVAPLKWQAPDKLTSRQKIEAAIEFPQTNFYSVENNKIHLKGDININEHLIIPKGYKVIIEAGTNINITDSATFISYSPIFGNGTVQEPINVFSTDHTSKGFNVIQAKGISELNYVKFEGLSNLAFRGWITPCAVCFYESDVNLSNCTFARNIGCDDALNVVRSNFNVDQCNFIETNADAFDSDFCTGTLTNSYFDKPGNDAIDFSGSVIHISNCVIEAAVDKGVSGGEGSTLYVSDTKITDCNIGVASKDRSVVEVSNSNVANCVYGLSAYVKKPEYGAAQIKVDNVTFNQNMFLHLIEEKSTLYFNNKVITGTARNVAERFY